ncbi:MAG TPA: N-acetylmuramoyl-L-alanine amidase [Solimonas sp.]|nr:N-acetylmuramoyl-L-alanine amidase [Solimonas sp.]
MRRLLALFLLCAAPLAQAAELRELRLWDGPESTRVVFDLNAAVKHEVFALSNPERVVIDITGLDPQAAAQIGKVAGKGLVQRVRSGPRSGGLRVVLEVSESVTSRSFLLAPNDEYGHRLVVDLSGSARSAPVAPPPDPALRLQDKPIVIAVDAGHGGEDPGARGSSGLLEKDVALSVARKLVRQINRQPGMRAVLTRDGDYYLGLRERVNVARKSQADMFVSVHCNAFHKRDMHGTAVYVLSGRGATSEQARWLAQKENAADMVGGVELHGKDDELAAVLIDLSQSATMEASFDVGSRILRSMGKVNTLQKSEVQQAGFAVLKAPDIPSVLVETAFITNAREEKLLASDDYQDKLADSILAGIQGYFQSYRPKQQMVEADNHLQKAVATDGPGGQLLDTGFTQGVSQ